MKIDLTYDPGQDRIRLCLRNDEQRSDWWLTRRIALRLLKALLNQLEKIPLPVLNKPWLPKSGQREIAQEHAMSLEFDAIRADPTAPKAPKDSQTAMLVEKVSLTVSPTDTRLELAAGTNTVRCSLTRMESHALIEAIALMARKGDWLMGIELPSWVGQTDPLVSGTGTADT